MAAFPLSDVQRKVLQEWVAGRVHEVTRAQVARALQSPASRAVENIVEAFEAWEEEVTTSRVTELTEELLQALPGADSVALSVVASDAVRSGLGESRGLRLALADALAGPDRSERVDRVLSAERSRVLSSTSPAVAELLPAAHAIAVGSEG